MAVVVGFAFLGVAVTPVRKRVFLLIVATIPNAMLRMTTTVGMGQKAAVGRKKRPPLAVKNSSLCYSIYMVPPIDNKVIIFLYRRSRTFFTANGGLFAICDFSACQQAGADGCGEEYPRACSRDIPRHTRPQRAKP